MISKSVRPPKHIAHSTMMALEQVVFISLLKPSTAHLLLPSSGLLPDIHFSSLTLLISSLKEDHGTPIKNYRKKFMTA